MRYRAYLAAGLIKADPTEVYCDRFDDEPTTLAVGIFEQGRCIGSMRLSFLEEAMSEGKLVRGGLSRGRAHQGPFARDDCRALAPGPRALDPQPFLPHHRDRRLVRAAIMACMAADVNVALAATRTHWVRFYQYMMGFKVVAGPSRYPPGDAGVPDA